MWRQYAKEALSTGAIFDAFPDRQKIEEVSFQNSSRKERERAQIYYGGQTKQVFVLIFQLILVFFIALFVSGITAAMIYSKYFI